MSARSRSVSIPWVAPQLATLTATAPPGDDWLHEIKYDGYRLHARITGSGVELLTRNQKDWTERFPAVAEALGKLRLGPALLDGEVAVELEGGITSFQALQNALNERSRGSLQFFLFDALFLRGEDLRALPLIDRKALLSRALRKVPDIIRYSDHVLGRGPAFFAQACEHGLEGIISKRASAPYRPGRGYDWLKVKCVREQEFVIGGFTEPGGSRQGLGALHVGAYDGAGNLVYRGKVGTGFTDATLRELRRKLGPLKRSSSPFTLGAPRGAAVRTTTWIEPKLVAQIRFTEITTDGVLRHPSFDGLREDKDPREVRIEEPQPVAPAADVAKSASARKRRAQAGSMGGGRSATTAASRKRSASTPKRPARKSTKSAALKPSGGERNPADPATKTAPRKQSRSELGAPLVLHGVRLSSPNRVLYPDEGITKLDLARYYETVSDWMLPHVKDRALTLVRCPNGHTGWCFFQKHVAESAPEQLGRVLVEESEGAEWYAYVHSLPGLVALAQTSALEVHSSNARRQQLEKPDRFTIDLDPAEATPWRDVVAAAFAVRDLLAELGLRSFVKTTGGSGLHVVVPLQRRSSWEEVKAFSAAVARVLVQAASDRYTTEMSKRKRGGRILLDHLRNAKGQTAIEAYSTRARSGAPVSAPLHWEELDRGAGPDQFTVRTMPQRIRKLKQDPWKDVGAVKQSLTAPMKRRLGL